jgi:RNAse (barnase) inhibitor barstar
MSFLTVLFGPTPPDIRLDHATQVWLRHFDLDFYRNHGHVNGTSDLANLSDRELLSHFVRRGYIEGRPYNRYFHAFLDPFFYIAKYPELNLDSVYQAMKHWMYHGVYEGRVPNRGTQDLVEARIHLFQMGKVGSKSIERAIRATGYTDILPHLHWQNEIMTTYSDCFFTYEEIIKRSEASDLNFVAGVREPISRLLSGFFESTKDPKSSLSVERFQNITKLSSELLLEQMAPQIDLILNWFDHKFYCDLDVYSVPFDLDSGSLQVQNMNGYQARKAFVYRLDKLDTLWGKLSSFLDMSLVLTHVNKAEEKSGTEEYQNVIKTLKFPKEYLQKVYSSKFCQHFFSEDEIAMFTERWRE